MITLKPANSGGYRALYDDMSVGNITMKDGEYYWWPRDGMFWEAFVLRDIAREIDKLNEMEARKKCGPSTEVVGRDYVPPTDLSQEPF